jgi:SAM-dependent methyltransferase
MERPPARQIRAYYDEWSEREWHRFDRGPADRVNLEIHRRFLARLIQPGDDVLEVGAGPGRFTIQLAQLGARISVTDISPGQLELNVQKVGEAGYEQAVQSRQLADVADLSAFGSGTFDVTTAYGGPLSYLFERAGTGLDELLRVTRTGGTVAFSVMSRWGTLHRFLEAVVELNRNGIGTENSAIVRTGDLTGAAGRVEGMSLPHECHLFTWEEIEQLIAGRPCQLIDASASNFLSVRNDEFLNELSADEWAKFVDWEELACRSKGCLGGGTHILVALRKTG